MLTMLVTLVAAALLEVGGDAAIRRGLVRSAPAWMLLGGLALVAYGLTVNTNRVVEFGRLMGAYIVVFFVVSQAIAIAFFAEWPSSSLIVGGALVVLGGIVIQLGPR